jgi:hypothetical protein
MQAHIPSVNESLPQSAAISVGDQEARIAAGYGFRQDVVIAKHDEQTNTTLGALAMSSSVMSEQARLPFRREPRSGVYLISPRQAPQQRL